MKIELVHERCSGCRACQLVCALTNYKENNPKKAALKIAGHFPEPGTYEISLCNQCGVCQEVCPTGAISEEDGVYLIDKDTCIGCGVCVEACPTGTMYTHAEETAPIKCNLCGACVEYCPRKALVTA